MTSFPDFWNKLIENSLWFEQISVKYGRKNIKDVGQKFYIDLLARPDEFRTQNYEAWRRTFQKWLMWEPDAVTAPQLQQEEVKEPEETDPEKLPIPKSDPRYQQHLENWLKELSKVKTNFVVPRMSKKEMAEKGGWIPKAEEGEPFDKERQIKAALEHMETILSAKRKEFLHYNPDASEDEISAYIETFKLEFDNDKPF